MVVAVAALLGTRWGQRALAQAGAAAPAAPPAAAPAPPAAAPTRPAPTVPIDDPALRLLLASNPRTPEELFRVIYLLSELERTAEAAPLVARFVAANPDAATLARIVRRYGADALFRLGRGDRLGADGAKMIDMLLRGAQQHVHDPRRIDALIRQLRDPHPAAQRAAIADLSEAGTDAVEALVSVLADGRRTTEHAGIRRAISELGSVSIAPLAGALEAPDEPLRLQAIECFGRIARREAAVHVVAALAAPDSSPKFRAAAERAVAAMVGPLPVADEAEDLLRSEARAYLDGKVPLQPGADGAVPVWHWDPSARRIRARRYPADVASAVIAARIARDLLRVHAALPANRRLWMVSGLQAEKLVGGMDQPLASGKGSVAAAAAEWGAAAVDEALSDALRAGHVPAAVAACEVLAALGDPSVLTGLADQPAALVEAARHPDRRLRFAAAAAVMKLRPREPFAGSSHVVEALAYFAGSAGRRRAVVADPRPNQGRSLAAMLAELGIDADLATSGRACRELLAASADYEFLLVSVRIDRPPAGELIDHLRQDARTALLPIGLVADEESLPRARRLAAAGPRAIALVLPTAKVAEGDVEHGLYRFYALHRLSADAAREAVLRAIGEARVLGTEVIADRRGRRLLVRGTDAIHERVAQALSSLDAPAEDGASREPRGTDASQPATPTVFLEHAIRRLEELAGPHAVDEKLRLAQADQALSWLAELSSEKGGINDVRRHERMVAAALAVPPLAPKAANVLANLGTHAGQLALVDTASQHARPLAVRQAAAAAFAAGAARFGVQLTREQVQRQYDRYNATRDLDEATQELMGLILDAIESPPMRKASPSDAGGS